VDKRRGYRRSGFSDYAGTALDASNRRWKAIATAVRYETSPEPKGRALVELAEFAAANGKPDLSAAFLKALEDELGCCCRPREVPPPPPEDKAPREEKGCFSRPAAQKSLARARVDLRRPSEITDVNVCRAPTQYTA